MNVTKSKKRNFIEISSSSDESEPENAEEISSSNSSDHDDDGGSGDESEYEEKDEDDDDEPHVQGNNESMCDRVIQLLRERNDLQELSLLECKAYLRRHRLRLSGTKAECIERIKEHLRLKDRNCEALYPRSSFTIDCTGDVCKGDVVLFNQKVYKSFNKMTRCGDLLGRRTVVGRIVNENYGAAKQQHTFTIEVLWSKGIKRLPLLFPLLVKGRNLYKLRTFRQRWNNEKERLKVIAEKHKRGAEARAVRAMRKAKAGKNCKKFHMEKGTKRHKSCHQEAPSGTKKMGNMRMNHFCEPISALGGNKNSIYLHRSPPAFQAINSKQTGDFRGPESNWKHKNLLRPIRVQETIPYLPYASRPYQDSYHFNLELDNRRRSSHNFPSHKSSVSAVTLPHFYPLSRSVLAPASECQGFDHGRYVHDADRRPSGARGSRKF